MTEIDYEALGRLAQHMRNGDAYDDEIARAVVAALWDQGFVVLGGDDVQTIIDCSDDDWARGAYRRVRAALAAPGDGETT